MNTCPCGSNQSYENCCHKFISGNALPETPEQLMRSRYTAYALLEISYIENTMLAPANVDFNAEEAKQWAEQVQWVKLEVLSSSMNGNQGSVEFSAHFKSNNKNHVLHEISQFEKKDGKWFYTDGITPKKNQVKISRNDPCPCGSLQKYKKCCGKNA